jgi:hypothetical protein
MISSTIPSAKYSCFGSPLRLAKGRTAIEGLSRRATSGLGGFAATGPTLVGAEGSCTTPIKPRVLIRRCCPAAIAETPGRGHSSGKPARRTPAAAVFA